jgi:Holliday junction resolvase-like predicted endonuclease
MTKIKTRSYQLRRKKIQNQLLCLVYIIMILLLAYYSIQTYKYISNTITIIEMVIIVILFIILRKTYKKYIIINAGIKGEKETKNILKQLDNRIVYANIPIEYRSRKSEIDYLCISKKGLYIVEVKNYSGHIKGAYGDKYWKQYKKEEIKNVKNPLIQLNNQINILSSMLEEKGIHTHVEGCVYFPLSSSIECKDIKIVDDSSVLLNKINQQNQKLTNQQIKQIKKIL